MTVAIDYDGTYTALSDYLCPFIFQLQADGHEVVIVTGRSNDGEWGIEVEQMIGNICPIVFAGNRWKRWAAEEAGYKVDVWIDDHPEYVGPQKQEFMPRGNIKQQIG